MSFFKKLGKIGKDLTKSDKGEKIEKKALELLLKALLKDEVIQKMVATINAYIKLNISDPIISKIENSDLSPYFDQMLLIDFFLGNDNMNGYITGEMNKIIQVIDKIINKLKEIIDKTYGKLTHLDEDLLKNISELANNFLQEDLNQLKSLCDEVVNIVLSQSTNIPKKYLEDSIENVASSFESLMLTTLNIEGLAKTDYGNIATMLLDNGVISKDGQFNAKMLEGVVASGNKLVPFLVLSNLTGVEEKPKKEEKKKKKGGIFGGLKSGFDDIKSGFGGLKKNIDNFNADDATKNINSIKSGINNIVGGFGGAQEAVQKIIETLKDIDFGIYEKYKQLIEEFCVNFYKKIEEFINENLNFKKKLMKLIEISILLKIIHCISSAFNNSEFSKALGDKKDMIDKAIELLKPSVEG